MHLTNDLINDKVLKYCPLAATMSGVRANVRKVTIGLLRQAKGSFALNTHPSGACLVPDLRYPEQSLLL